MIIKFTAEFAETAEKGLFINSAVSALSAVIFRSRNLMPQLH